MSNTHVSTFVENLLQFSLEKRGILWQPVLRNSPVECPYKLFDETIGNEVANVSIIYERKVKRYSRRIWNYIVDLPDFERVPQLSSKINEISLKIYFFKSGMIDTYIFLSVMVDVSIRCASHDKQHLIQDFVYIISDVLNSRMPDGFVPNFGNFSWYAYQPFF